MTTESTKTRYAIPDVRDVCVTEWVPRILRARPRVAIGTVFRKVFRKGRGPA